MQNFSLASLKNSLDEVRAQVYPRNETERKVYEALSSKNWGASSTLLNEIASDSNDYEKYGIMSNIIWANLDTDGKSWKQIFKTLTLIDFLIKNGSERFIEASRDKLYRIRTLQDYNFYEGTVDKGSGVREKAKSLIEMLGNNEVIRSERDKARQLRNKFVGIDSRNAGGGGGGGIYGGNFYDNNGGVSSNNGGGNGNHNNNNGTSNSGRYGGGPSYDINGRYGDQGIYSQSSNDRRGSQVTNHSNVPSRFGGGAYDSDHPPRYGDDIPVTKYEDESSSIILPTAPIGGGKLKISIKKATLPVAVSIQNVVAAPEIDLFGDSGDVDLMYVGPATAASHGGNILFDAFSSAASATPLHQTSFDPFDNRAPPTAPINNCGAPAFDPFGAVPSAPCDACAAQPLVQSFDPFAVVHQPFPPFHRQQQPFFALHTPQTTPASVTIALNRTPSNTSHTSQQQSHETEFGDFEIAPQQQQQKSALTPIASKWGDLGKLVDLSSIGKNEVQAKLSAAGTDTSNNNHQSGFAGLDGYSKTVYNMTPTRPVNYPTQQQMGVVPTDGMARPGQPMGMAPQVPMGGAGLGMTNQPGYAAPQMQRGPIVGSFQQHQQPNIMYAPQMQQQYGQQQQQHYILSGGNNQQQPGMGMGGFPLQQYAPNNGSRNTNSGFGF